MRRNDSNGFVLVTIPTEIEIIANETFVSMMREVFPVTEITGNTMMYGHCQKKVAKEKCLKK